VSGAPPRPDRRLAASGLLSGAGLMGSVDEIVFHQLLGWHSLYDGAGETAALVSDGLLHAVTLAAVVAGLALLAGLRRRGAFDALRWWALLLLGAGAFQLWDGVVDHKLLGLHQIRYGVDTTAYDLAWNASAVALLAAGAALLVRARRRRAC
jgi:uncharacterized membrane protein